MVKMIFSEKFVMHGNETVDWLTKNGVDLDMRQCNGKVRKAMNLSCRKTVLCGQKGSNM